MKPTALTTFAKFVVLGLAMPLGGVHAAPFSSGSTGADGPFSPTQDITLQVPPDGKFNYTTITIPLGVDVRFTRNSRNTPVYMLATGNVIINGNIDVGGQDAGTGGDFSLQGRGGPGGGDGGRGGPTPSVAGGDGLGPGGGHGGIDDNTKTIGGGGGGYQVAGSNATSYTTGLPGSGGPAYGTAWVQPLAGGSGGGGGAGSSSSGAIGGGGGGGGGGAILIASSGTISGSSGFIVAQGGTGSRGGSALGAPRCDGTGGGGSGGAIRLLAAAITFPSSRALVDGGSTTGQICTGALGGTGGAGFKRFEVLFGGTLDISNNPTLSITRVAGIDAPVNLTGYGDITLPANTPNPVSVELRATNIPPGGTVTVTVSPSAGPSVSVTSTILVGTQASSTATAQISVPNGLSSVQATANYSVPLALVEPLTRYAGEAVKSLKLTSVLNGGAKTLVVTASGRELEVPPALLMQIALLDN